MLSRLLIPLAALAFAACGIRDEPGRHAEAAPPAPAVLQGCAREPLGGGPAAWTMSRAVDANTHGDVLGSVGAGDSIWRPALWRNGHLFVLDLPAGFRSGEGRLLNDAGDVLISAWREGESRRAELFLWRAGRMRRVAGLPGTDPEVAALNNRAQLAGTFRDSSGFRRGFIWSEGGWSGLSELYAFAEMGGYHVVVHDLNDEGAVAGQVQTVMDDPGDVEAFVWHAGEWTLPLYEDSLDVPSEFRAIDGRGDAYGMYWRGEVYAPLAWRGGAVDTAAASTGSVRPREIKGAGRRGLWTGLLPSGQPFAAGHGRVDTLRAPQGFRPGEVQPAKGGAARTVVGQVWEAQGADGDARAAVWERSTPVLLPLQGERCAAVLDP